MPERSSAVALGFLVAALYEVNMTELEARIEDLLHLKFSQTGGPLGPSKLVILPTIRIQRTFFEV